MQKRITFSVIALAALLALAGVVALSAVQVAQAQDRPQAQPAVPSIPSPPGWKPCPRCQNNADRAEANKKYGVEGHAFNPRDFTGVWGFNGSGRLGNPPPLTPLGKKLHDATIGEKNEYGEYLHSKDTSGRGGGSLINCDPPGWPRLHVYNYGIEFVMMPDRILQFFQLPQTWRTIWMDGRKLPEEPPVPQWLGWTVGRWEGDELVIESTGYDDRAWVDSSNPDGGWPHTEELKVVERWKRLNYGTLESQITVIDPQIYTAPWVGPKSTTVLVPGAELWENFCVPSEHVEFNYGIHLPAAGVKK